MIRKLAGAVAVFAGVSLLGCGGVTTSEAFSVSMNAANGQGDNGTALTATCTNDGVTCNTDGTGVAGLSGLVSTTGSVDSVEITVQVDGAARAQVGLIQPQDWTHDGRNKTAPYAISLTLPNGAHSIVVCFTESGAQGRTPKEYCTAAVAVTIDCPVAVTCADEAPFGDLVGNPSLCKGNGPPHIPVHVKGDFGESPSLNISGPNGYVFSTAMRHAGDSCVYQYNWDTAGNGGAGTYSFTVSGNDKTLSFSAELHCK